jgi:hypothetical protein
MTATLTTRALPSPDVLFQNLGGEAVLLDLKTETYFGLNPVGTRMWELITGGDTRLGDAVDTLLGEFDVERERLQADLLRLAGELAAAGLVKLQEA